MIELKKFCELLYRSVYIPIYLYNKTELIVCYPNQEYNILPSSSCLKKLFENKVNISYTQTRFYSYYGCINVEGSEMNIVIGPVSPLPYSREALLNMHHDFLIKESETEKFDSFLCNIQTQNSDVFLNTLLFINYCINEKEQEIDNILLVPNSLMNELINKKYYENVIVSEEKEIFNISYNIERELYGYIQNGDIKKLNLFFNNLAYEKYNSGIIADNNMRQKKNNFIMGITQISRTAIKGGLTPDTAFSLCNIYIQQMERLSDIISIDYLMVQAVYDFANRISNSKVPADSDDVIKEAIKYVLNNIYLNIKVADVAEHLHYNRSYLSRKFKNKLGLDLSEFIQKCKLEEAKSLLEFSDNSISDISSFLCFSSQSHFQRAFKQKYGFTPQTYRNSVKHI